MGLYDCVVCGEFTKSSVRLIDGTHTTLCPKHRTEFNHWAQDNLEGIDRFFELSVRTAAMVEIGEEDKAAKYLSEANDLAKAMRPAIKEWLESIKQLAK